MNTRITTMIIASLQMTLSHWHLPPLDNPQALQPLFPNILKALVSFSLQPSCGDLNLLPLLNWGDSSLNHRRLVVLPPLLYTLITRLGNIGPSVRNSPHKRKGRVHWCASHGRIGTRIHLVLAETMLGDWWRRGHSLRGGNQLLRINRF